MNDDNELRSVDLGTDFDDQYVKWRSFAQGCAFWGEFYISTPFSPKTQIFGQFFTRQKFRLKKALTVGILICKLPLIVIVAPWKSYSK